MTKEIATTDSSNLMGIIEKVVLDPNVDVEKMSKILDMQERIFNKNAEISFNGAMSKCQKEMPAITRDKVNQQTNSKYAKFESILTVVKPVYTQHGFALSFGTDETAVEGHIRITCDLLHDGGFSKHYFVDLPMDNMGIKGNANKTAVHGTGSTYSYGKRYLITMIFNIAIADEDDDGVKSGGLMDHAHCVRDNFDIVSSVKEGIANDDLMLAAGAWFDLTQEEQNKLWRAPTNGGIFTTEERSIMQSSDFTSANFSSADQG